MTPDIETIARTLAGDREPQKTTKGFLTLCPCHADSNFSLSLSIGGKGQLIYHCHGECDQGRLTAWFKAKGYLSSNGNGAQTQKPRIVATYDYTNPAGELVFQVVRREPKDFRQRRPDGKGGWIWNLQGVARVPYRLPEVLKAQTIYFCEGEKDVDRLAAMGLTATCNPGGAGKWRADYNRHFQGKAVAIFPDNDPPGKAHALDVARNLHGVAASVKVIDLPGLPPKGDVSDWIGAGGTKGGLLNLVDQALEWKPITPVPTNEKAKFLNPLAAANQAKSTPAIRFVSGAELEAMDFPEPVWIIPNILGEGYIILAGRPKLGKSWLALCLAVAVSTGGCALGKGELRAVQGKVLYLALEDRLRRIKARLSQILCGSPFPENLLIAESWERLDRGGLEDLRLFLKEHDDCRLVVIDTLAKVRPPRQKNTDPYEFDMAVGGALQTLAHQYGVSILVVHHTRKSAADDPLDEVSGTTGITGAADAIMILKRGRGQVDGTLTLTGRDIEEQELALKFHGQEGLWELMCQAAEYSMSQERQDILTILSNVGPKTPAQLAKILDKNRNSIKAILFRMKDSGLVKANDKGEYETLSI